MLMLPESPIHLVNKVDPAVEYIRKKNEDVLSKNKCNQEEANLSRLQKLNESVSSLFNPSTLKPFLTCLVLQFVQQWCGVHVIVFKTVNVFETFHTSVDHNMSTIIVGAVAFGATFCKCVDIIDLHHYPT